MEIRAESLVAVERERERERGDFTLLSNSYVRLHTNKYIELRLQESNLYLLCKKLGKYTKVCRLSFLLL